MNQHDEIADFLDQVDARLDRGAAEYGNQSFVRAVAKTADEILEEQADQVGWLYVLWCQAARKTAMVRDQVTLRIEYRRAIEHRIRRNDRRRPLDHNQGAQNCMADIEVLAIDLFHQGQELRNRLLPIARAIEVAQVIEPEGYRGRRGSIRNPRSDD